MTTRRTIVLAAAIVLGLAALIFLRVGRVVPNAPTQTAATASTATVRPEIENQTPKTEGLSGTSQLADALNAPSGSIRRDLEILNEIFTAWQTNFPRTGNPVGENAEITAALTGANPVRYAFIPPVHPAINARGELCDRWGTPFRFHQLSGTQMEIRSAGPDRKFGTTDDADFTPGSLIPVPR